MKTNFLAATLIVVVLANTADAAPPPPPNQADWEAAIASSCGASKHLAQGELIPVTTKALSVDEIGGKEDVGKLQYLWGERLSSPDPRFGEITAITFEDVFGLLAVTDQGNWVAIDLEPNKIGHIHIAPMPGVKGKPAAILRGLTYYVSFSDRTGVVRFDVPTCGLDAKPVPVAKTNVPVTAMASVAYGYSMFVGRDAVAGTLIDTVADINFLKPSQTIELRPAADIPVLPGHGLIGLSGPERIVPYNLISLWRPSGNNRASTIQSFNLSKWDDVQPSPNFSAEILADIPVSFAAATATYSLRDGVIYIGAATHALPGEPTDILFFSWKPEHS